MNKNSDAEQSNIDSNSGSNNGNNAGNKNGKNTEKNNGNNNADKSGTDPAVKPSEKSRPRGFFANKMQFSMVFRLNIRHLVKLISAFMTFNLILVILLIYSVLWKAEQGMGDLGGQIAHLYSNNGNYSNITPREEDDFSQNTDQDERSIRVSEYQDNDFHLNESQDNTPHITEQLSDTGITPEYSRIIEPLGYRIIPLTAVTEKLTIPSLFHNILPLEGTADERIIFFGDTLSRQSLIELASSVTPHPGVRVSEGIESLQYGIVFKGDDSGDLLIYNIGSDLIIYLYILIVIAAIQFLILLGNLFSGGRSVRKILAPLSEMAEKARILNEEVNSLSSTPADLHIKDLAGAISHIDADRLDRRISLDASQNELKDLAASINQMLDRISNSYKSQIRFVSDASHELRTPISVIQGYANLLDRWGKKDEKTMEESIAAIKSESNNMKELVEKLLFLARSDNNTIKLQKSTVDASEIVAEVIRETEIIDPNHNFRSQLEKPAPIYADGQLIKQAVRILMDNSIKYTPPGEEIIVRVSRSGKLDSGSTVNTEKSTAEEPGVVRIMVQDNGIGIEAEDIASIFDRFYRSDESRARKTGGSGLGLSIAQWIVDRHGGHFEVLSRTDIGTRTTIVIPATHSVSHT